MPLNNTHIKILRFVREYSTAHGYAPSLREIGKHIGSDSTSYVDFLVETLATSQMITRQKRIARSIVLTEKGRAELGVQA